MKKYLILTASYGSGHNAAATGIKNYLESKGEQVLSVDLTDLLKKGGDNSKKFYAFSEKFPFIWDATFNLLDQEFANEILDLIFKSIYQKKFNEIMDLYSPDFIICTFPNWPAFIKNYCKHNPKTFKVGVVITDAIEIGMPWYFGNQFVDNYFVIDDNSRLIFKKKFKHRKNNINTTFFPIEKKYFINKLSIQNKEIAILLTGLKYDIINKLLFKLKQENFYTKIRIIKGRNDKVFQKIKGKNKDSRFEYLEFINIKEELINIDIFICKPGGATMCECIACDVPLICPSFTPGQEEGNIKLLQTENLGIYENDPDKIIFYLKFLDWNKFLSNFKKIKNNNSIENIIKKMSK